MLDCMARLAQEAADSKSVVGADSFAEDTIAEIDMIADFDNLYPLKQTSQS